MINKRSYDPTVAQSHNEFFCQQNKKKGFLNVTMQYSCLLHYQLTSYFETVLKSRQSFL